MSYVRFQTRGGFALDCASENCIDLHMIVSQLMCSVCVDRIGVSDKMENQKIYKQSCLSLGKIELQDVVLKLNQNGGTFHE